MFLQDLISNILITVRGILNKILCNSRSIMHIDFKIYALQAGWSLFYLELTQQICIFTKRNILSSVKSITKDSVKFKHSPV